MQDFATTPADTGFENLTNGLVFWQLSDLLSSRQRASL
jgi:hypothetical protein